MVKLSVINGQTLQVHAHERITMISPSEVDSFCLVVLTDSVVLSVFIIVVSESVVSAHNINQINSNKCNPNNHKQNSIMRSSCEQNVCMKIGRQKSFSSVEENSHMQEKVSEPKLNASRFNHVS